MLKNLKVLFVSFSGLALSSVSALADAPAAPAAAPGFAATLVPFAAMFAIIYFLMIRPQQKKMKEQQEMVSQLKQGDEILTQSGILGKISGVTDKVVTVEIADGVRVKMMKTQVSQVVKGSIKDLA